MTKLRKIAFATLAAPLALGLAACGSEETEGAPQGEPVAAVPAPEGQSWESVVTYNDRGGYMMGNPDAPIKLVEYGSLTCPGCAQFSVDGSRPLIEKYINTGKVQFEFRSFIIHGPLDMALTAMIGCGAPETAIPLADQVWANLPQIQQQAYADQGSLERSLTLPENQRFVAFADVAGLYDFFAARGLSEEQAKTCLADFGKLEKYAELSQSYSQDDKVTGTPTFELNGNRLTLTPSERSWPQVEAALQRAGAR